MRDAKHVIPFMDVDDDVLTDEQIRLKYAPVTIGPTWQKDEDGKWLLPERTLGWQVLGWAAKWLRSPTGDGPYVATPEMARWILWWFAVDCDGNYLYRNGTLQRLKGWGKDPLAAVLCLVELCGPSRFGGWDKDGQPIGKPHPTPWVQIAAVNQDQTRNTTTMFAILITDAMKAEYSLDVGKELIYANNGRGRLEAVTSSPRALEGGRSTFIILNEGHHMLQGNQGIEMYQTVRRNAAKMKGRWLSITNAYQPGEDSVAERVRDAWQRVEDGLAEESGHFYDSLEAPAYTPMLPRVIKPVLDMVRGDSKWLDIDLLMKEILDTSIPISTSRRFYFNQIVATEDSLYSPGQWKACEVDDALEPGDEVTLGFDGGKTDDATALVAVRVRDGLCVPLGVWEKPDGPSGEGWTVDRRAVDSAVHDAFRIFKVRAFYADVNLWESHIDSWSEQYGKGLGIRASSQSMIGRDMRGEQRALTLAHQALMSAIFDGIFRHNGDRILTRHALNAMRASNNYGISFRKESRESKRKVDAYAAAFLAFTARREYLDKGKAARERTGRGYFC